MTTNRVEIALAYFFNPRINLIVPRVDWGLSCIFHECDLLILSKAGYATEVEIKVSLSDIKKDLQKRHNHIDKPFFAGQKHAIKRLYFAVPERHKESEYIPKHTGIITFTDNLKLLPSIQIYRKSPIHSKYKWSEKERYDLARLGALRIWDIKKKLITNSLNQSG